ncbi:MAG: hypothetical protein NXI08_07495 [bacterium]|jgi:hypothetical protein|nr:hypothetical protein [bacterium]
MKNKLLTLVLIAASMFAYSCGESNSSSVEVEVEAIVGEWVSEGASNVAVGLQALTKTARIDADFEENGTYNVVSTDSAGAQVTFTGTYSLGEGEAGDIRTITLTQATPTSLTSAGIFQIQGNTMTYEVIQTEPNIGAEAPTVEGGFGSTLVGGSSNGTIWVQGFARQ